MKKIIVPIAVLALAGAAAAQVNPARPMVTGRGNVASRPGSVIVTNQTEEMVKLDKFLVTGSLQAAPAAATAQVDPARPMVTGRGNVASRPGSVIVTNQTEELVKLDKFLVTGSLLPKASPEIPKK